MSASLRGGVVPGWRRLRGSHVLLHDLSRLAGFSPRAIRFVLRVAMIACTIGRAIARSVTTGSPHGATRWMPTT